MPKPESVRLLTDGPLKSFGQGHLEFVTDKEQTRRTGGFGIFEEDSAKLWKESLEEGDCEGAKGRE